MLFFIGDYKMNPAAYVTITTEQGAGEEVLKGLKKIPGVKKASAVYGRRDIVAIVYKPTMDGLKETITWRVRKVDKVRDTETLIVVEDESAFSRNEEGKIEKFKL
jgi:DNA-binding Lrp family transcriptional regulator